VAFVTREDCARAAAAALSGNSTGRRTLTVTGPESLTGEEVAAITTELFGRKVTRVQLTAQALDQALREHGLPAPVAALFVSFDLGIARGDLAPVADTVQALTGRAPQSVRDFLSEHRAALAPQE
jgi:NAD(P)H dehydrogenase (quinone)